MKPQLTQAERDRRQLEKEEILLQGLKNELSTLGRHNDPFGDGKLCNEQVVAYCIAENKEVRLDPKQKGRFRFVVETSLFGGKSKHIDAVLWEEMTAI